MKKIRNLFRKKFPKINKIFKILRDDIDFRFSGWGMNIRNYSPWDTSSKNIVFSEFNKSHQKLLELVINKKFTINEFTLSMFGGDEIQLLNDLRWRHYIVHFTASLAFSQTNSKNIVECGVCDGMTAFFAINKFKSDKNYKAYLYDSWEAMKEEFLLNPSDKRRAGSYANINIEDAKKNLIFYKDNIIFNKGFIPNIFTQSNNPQHLSWLHIDLNSSMPTKESLKFFYPLLQSGGVILFDDYAANGYEDTKVEVDNFLLDKKGQFLHIPTGQGFFIKE